MKFNPPGKNTKFAFALLPLIIGASLTGCLQDNVTSPSQGGQDRTEMTYSAQVALQQPVNYASETSIELARSNAVPTSMDPSGTQDDWVFLGRSYPQQIDRKAGVVGTKTVNISRLGQGGSYTPNAVTSPNFKWTNGASPGVSATTPNGLALYQNSQFFEVTVPV